MAWIRHVAPVFWVVAGAASVEAEELYVGKACPVFYQQESVATLVFSREWYHTSREQAAYIPRDSANGIGIEIHLFATPVGDVRGQNIAECDRYRLLQVRSTNARLLPGEQAVQVDVPPGSASPFYDAGTLEHGYGTHYTPADIRDKPWQERPQRASTVSIYDTPFITSYLGIDGKDIHVGFETCAVCERDSGFDTLLSCGRWGFRREYLGGGMSAWAEPDFTGVQCQGTPSPQFQQALNRVSGIEYVYWLGWRTQ